MTLVGAPPTGTPAHPVPTDPTRTATPVALGRIPVVAVALVFAAPAIGDRMLPGGSGLQLVHVVCVAAIGVTALWALGGGLGRRPSRLIRPEVRTALLCGGAVVVAALTATLFNAITGDRLLRGLKVSATLAAGWLVVLAIVTVADTPARRRALLAAGVLGSLTVTLPILTQAQQLSADYGGAIVRNRAQSVFADPNQFGCYAAVTVLLATGWFVAARHRWERIGAIVGGTGAAAALTLSLSRGAWVGTLVGLTVFAVLYPPSRRRLATLAVVGGVVGAAALTLTVAPVAGPASVVLARVEMINDRGANPYDVRPVTWREARRQFAASPLVGNGPGAFSTLSAMSPSALQFAPRRHAHNAVLNTAAETGAMGVGAGVGFVLTSIATALVGARRLRGAGRWRELGLLAGAGGALTAVATHLMVDYPVRNPVLMVAIWAVVGLLLTSAIPDGSGPAPERPPGTGPAPADATGSGPAPNPAGTGPDGVTVGGPR